MTHTNTDTRYCPACVAEWDAMKAEGDLDSESVPFVSRSIMRQHFDALDAAAERAQLAAFRRFTGAARQGAPETYRFR